MTHKYVLGVALLAGLGTVGTGIWMLAAPHSFATFAGFGENEHFVHDLGAFNLGLGGALLLATIWADGLAVALGAFLVGNTVHTVNHLVDRHLGGHAGDAVLLGALSVLVAVALWLRLRSQGYVVGRVAVATSPALAPYVRQKTVRLTTYRRDGRTGTTPISIAVEGDHGYLRSFERSVKTRRLRHDPRVEIGPATATGRATGPAVPGRVRRLDGTEYRHAAALLRAKYPFLHGVFVPLTHRLARRRTGRTVHFELVIGDGGG